MSVIVLCAVKAVVIKLADPAQMQLQCVILYPVQMQYSNRDIY